MERSRKNTAGRLEYYEQVEDTVVQRAWLGIVGQDSSKHSKHASSHDKMDWLENEVTRPHGNTKKGSFYSAGGGLHGEKKQATQSRVTTGPQLARGQLAPRAKRSMSQGRTSQY